MLLPHTVVRKWCCYAGSLPVCKAVILVMGRMVLVQHPATNAHVRSHWFIMPSLIAAC